jgi:hypothetical protein
MITKKPTFIDKRFCPSCGGEFCKSDGGEILPYSYKTLGERVIHKCGWVGRVIEFATTVESRNIKLKKLYEI